MMHKVLLPDKYADIGGRALDGSMALYFYAPSDNASTLWVIELEGGGRCHRRGTDDKESDCDVRSASKLGSSAAMYHPDTMRGAGILSDDTSINPRFAMAHKVFVPCARSPSGSSLV